MVFNDVFISRLLGVFVFSFFSLSLILPSGYSYGAVGLLFLSFYFVFKGHGFFALSREDFWVVFSLVLFFVVALLEFFHSGFSFRELDQPLRFLLAALIIPVFFSVRVNLVFLWAGIAFGAIGSGLFAIYQSLFIGLDRVKGHMAVIEFGNISMLLAMLCLAGLSWSIGGKKKTLWSGLLFLGFFMGFMASMLSGTRGGWIGLPLILVFFLRVFYDSFGFARLFFMASVFLFSFSFLYFMLGSGVSDRVYHAYNDVALYFDGVKNTSIGLRLEMWKSALVMFFERPAHGWGSFGYIEQQIKNVEYGFVVPEVLNYTHAHNEILDAAAKKGLVGVFALLSLYFLPLYFFYRYLFDKDFEIRSLAIGGVVLILCVIDFGLSNVFFNRNSGVMVFSLSLAIFWGLLSSYSKQVSGSNSFGFRNQV